MIRLVTQQVGREPDFCLEGNEFVVKLPRKEQERVKTDKKKEK